MTKKYNSVSIPESLMKKIDELIEKEETTYTSKTEFVKDAIRIRLRDFGLNV